MEKQDFLDVDKQIPGQNFVCMSFLSPEDQILKKELYVMEKFRESFFSKYRKLFDELKELSQTNQIVFDHCEQLEKDSMEEFYEGFLMNEREKHENDFNEKNEQKCSTRGIKVRGTYATIEEAQNRAKNIQKKDKYFNVFVGQVGYWLPWDPKAENIQNQEYGEEKLNELMKEYKNNFDTKNEIWDEVTKERIERAKLEGQSNKENN